MVVGVTLTWLRGGNQLDGLNFTSVHWLIGEPAEGHAIRRTIAHFQLTIHNPDAADVDNLIAYGAVFAIEVTLGDVTPDEFSIGSMEGRDLLHMDVAPGRLIQGQNDAIKYIAIPADTGYMTIDTNVQRLAKTSAGLNLWAGWALIPTLTGDLNTRQAFDFAWLNDDNLG